MHPDLTTVILTYNEEQHIERAIRSVQPVSREVLVVDSFSKDRTVEIAEGLGARVLQNPFVNQAQQYQWAIDNGGIGTGWTLRIDADEYLEPELQDSVRALVGDPGEVNAVYLRRKICFLGRPITHGFFYPGLILRMYRTGQGRMEQRWMDEHIVVESPVERTLAGDLVDENLNPLSWWTAKHVDYARREAYEIIAARVRQDLEDEASLSGQARRKRWLKEKVYGRMPSALRSTLYFFYRYVLGRGFLDGKAGFFFHFLQGYWYRTYVDAALYEIECAAGAAGASPYEFLCRQGVFER
ncbi:glycosyltransferase family 2 protein [Mangrovicoccus sp. HB161399]|uniref:glycosyltransferase family 2 protein n=1 Tax=Mangrovicoccus sp. HB161399 TaxID=2720392 RepID=UPI0015527C80|nr:glycosyltransferase family 2 protein [Mangrovicoccus sp. HB161399]